MSAPRNLVLGTAGHIDHGKTALVRALTGVDTDRLPAEKLRGITIDLGFAALDFGDIRMALVDVPGHEKFIRNMLAGASGLDLALLVIAADDSVMPQTREHLEILNLLGLRGGVIALTKCDVADASWIEMVEDDVRGLVAGTFLEDASIVRTSSRTGEGIDALKIALSDLGSSISERGDLGPFRMAIDRSFTRAGLGTIVTGTVASGTLNVGDEVQWMPEGRIVKVRGLHRHDQPVMSVQRGARAAVNLGGVHHLEIRRGHELAFPGYLQASRLLSVSVKTSADAPRALKHRCRYRLHIGTSDVTASLVLFEGNTLLPGDAATAQLALAEPIVAVAGEPFILREESPPATLGGGIVIHASPKRIRRRDRSAVDRLKRFESVGPAERIAMTLEEMGLEPWDDLRLCRESNVPLAEVRSHLDELRRSGHLVELSSGARKTISLAHGHVSELENRVTRALGRLHGAHPRQTAIRRAMVAGALPDLPGEALISAILERLIAKKVVVGDARTVALAEFQPKLSHSERKLKAEIAVEIREGGFSPPDLNDFSAKAAARASVVPELLAILVAEGHVVAVSNILFLDADVDASLVEKVISHLQTSGTMTMAELRDLLQTTRKFAVPIAEYLDRIGVTRREGDLRLMGHHQPEARLAHV